jgi:excisionase family DNA binding protein
MPHTYMTTQAAATRLGVVPMTILRWLANGTLTGHRCGANWCVDADAVERMAAD